jgi:hypothetical protein
MNGLEDLLPRRETPFVADERTMLLAWLAYHRSTMATKCQGLDELQLKTRPVVTSGMSLLGLLRHWTDVERYWIRELLLGEKDVVGYSSAQDRDGDFDNLDDTAVDVVIETWIAEGRHTVAVLTAAEDLDVICAGSFGGGDQGQGETQAELDWVDEGGSAAPEVPSVRWIMTHLIEEFARHNGHADLLRELLDGSTGE